MPRVGPHRDRARDAEVDIVGMRHDHEDAFDSVEHKRFHGATLELAPSFTPAELVGLLADDDRRRVFAALVLGASDTGEIRRMSGLDARAAGRALQRLVDSGLVIRGDDATHHLLGEAFGLAARAEAERAPRADEHADAPEDVARVLRAFVHDGRLTSIPAVHSKRLVILDWLAQRFEPGRRYTEADGEPRHRASASRHRRAPPLSRGRRHDGSGAGVYWRAGGTVSE